MIRNKKAMLFCSQMILTGALMTGAPCLVFGDNTQTSEISQISDHSGEGQIHKPEHPEAPDFTSDPNFIDDSTDNTAGYYTIVVWQMVTVAFFLTSIIAAGFPTTRLLPITTAFLPVQSIP